jgi:hypothetical protein
MGVYIKPTGAASQEAGIRIIKSHRRIRMKNKFFPGLIATVLIAGFALARCMTFDVRADLGIFDVSTPMEGQCMLKIGINPDPVRNILNEDSDSTITIHRFDGEQVYWPSHAKILVPAGRHTLLSSGSRSNTSYYTPSGGSYTNVTRTTNSGEDTLVHVFEAGKIYEASYGYNGLHIEVIKGSIK